MKQVLILVTIVLAMLPGWAPAGGETVAEEVLLLRFALLVGGRDASQVPIVGEARSAEDLARFLVEWEPGQETDEIRELFALEGLSEVIRQALVLPAAGGQSNSTYEHGGVSFEVRLDIQPATDDSATVAVEVRRDGAPLAAPTVKSPFGERAIVSTTNGPEAPFLFLVVEVDRVSRESIERRGLRYAWREDVMTVGEDVTAPRAILKEMPHYTEPARKERIQGVVILRLVIDKTGEVAEVEVLKGLPHGLNDSAIEAVRKWKFEPARHEGKPVSVLFNITVNFRLEKEPKKPAAGAG